MNSHDDIMGMVATEAAEAVAAFDRAAAAEPHYVTIYTEQFGRLNKCRLKVVWQPHPLPDGHAMCRQGMTEVIIVLATSCVHLQSIVHECHHAVNWMSALGIISGMEEQAQECGFMVENIVAALLRLGWTFGPKTSKEAIWNTDVPVALKPS